MALVQNNTLELLCIQLCLDLFVRQNTKWIAYTAPYIELTDLTDLSQSLQHTSSDQCLLNESFDESEPLVYSSLVVQKHTKYE